MSKDEYLLAENWVGGFWELAIEYHPKSDSARLDRIANALWKDASFSGPWSEMTSFSQGADEITSFEGKVYGLLSLPDGNDVGCLTLTIREDGEDGSDWLLFAIPMAMLHRLYPIIYIPRDVTADSKQNQWMTELDTVLYKMAQSLYSVSPFNLALIGHHVSGEIRQNALSLEEFSRANQFASIILPVSLVNQLKISEVSQPSSSDLYWFPRIGQP